MAQSIKDTTTLCSELVNKCRSSGSRHPTYDLRVRSWPTVDVPDIPGSPPPLQIHDTRAGRLVEPAPDGVARLYVCGITPYDATHLGHAATYLAFDLLQRQWLDRGLDVAYVQNVTDVDDPLLERASATGEPWEALAARELELFRTDMTALRMLPPQHLVGVVESLDDVAALVRDLGEHAYPVDADLYLDLRADPDFGSIAGLDEAAMRTLFAERGGDPDRPGKRDPLDCLLWRAPRPAEPSWDSVVGPGRPGWHVECAAIGLRYLGASFDIQGGGSDLAFPHHEMCASHVSLSTGEQHAKAYVHTGMVGYEGAKMSKSLGNLVLVSQLRDKGHDPAAIRLALLAHSYRSDWEWTDHDLAYAEARLARWRVGLDRVSTPPAEPLIDRIRDELARDLHTPGALAAVDDWCASPADAPSNGSDAVRRALDALLGIEV
jgi:L-cysteine:1D-myo-inositol 2-amino-2-deoxy-alpha-D-glucopyranoside ligase